MQIRPLDLDSEREFAQFHRVGDEAQSFERPFARRMSANELWLELTDQDPAERIDAFVAVGAGEVVGAGCLFLSQTDNLRLAYLVPQVAPDHRRAGIGTAMLEHLVGQAAADGRTDLVMESGYPFERREDHPYRRFAEKNGFTLANTEVRRILELPLPDSDLERLIAESAPHHEDYRIEDFEGEVPDELLPSLCHTKNQLAVDAPTGAVEYEEEQITPEIHRHREAALRKAGRTMLTTLAVSPDGEAVAFTDLVVSEHEAAKVHQWGTLVRRDHRGHRLGLAVKARALRELQARYPGATEIQTCNAEQNQHMVSINERLGFRPIEVSPAFLRKIG